MRTSIFNFFFLITGFSALAQTGNVGIGTATPGTKLDVNGAITNREVVVSVTSNSATVPANTSQVQLTGAASTVIAVMAPAAPNPGQRLVVYNNTTGGFSAVLNAVPVPAGQAMEFVYSNSSWQATNGGAAAANTQWRILGNAGTDATTNFIGTIDATDFVTRTNNTEKMRVTTGGNLGIGTATPSSRLDLGTTTGSNSSDVAGKKLAVYNNAAGTDFHGLGVNAGTLQFHAGSTASENPGMVLNNAGRVGIGTTAPNSNLEVIGDVRLPTVAVTPAVGPYMAIASNTVTGALGVFVPTPPISVIKSAYNSYVAGTSTKFELTTTTTISINTLGITVTDDATNGDYITLPAAGVYKIEGTWSQVSSTSPGNAMWINVLTQPVSGGTIVSYDRLYAGSSASTNTQSYSFVLVYETTAPMRIYIRSESGDNITIRRAVIANPPSCTATFIITRL